VTLDGGESLRERKRRQTREQIARAAMRLFAERGFDNVTVPQIAEAAGVAAKTVYNYFPVKAGIFFDEAGDILAELLAAVGNRTPGEPAIEGIRRFIQDRGEWAEGRRPAQPTRRFQQLIADSPALRAYQREMFSRYETALAALLADETGLPRRSVEPFVAAVALVAMIRAAFETTPSGHQPGRDTSGAALNLLAGGLGSYAVAGPASSCRRNDQPPERARPAPA
jgi:AcrR family transcriptional regulator